MLRTEQNRRKNKTAGRFFADNSGPVLRYLVRLGDIIPPVNPNT
jgi:hypothetical protein